jgi:hypothetical protein
MRKFWRRNAPRNLCDPLILIAAKQFSEQRELAVGARFVAGA